MFEREGMAPVTGNHHFGIMVRDEAQVAELREKVTKKYGLELIPPFRCDFRDPWGNRIQVVEYRDLQSVVIAQDGSLFPGEVVALTGAAQMQMALKNKSGGPIDPHAGHNH